MWCHQRIRTLTVHATVRPFVSLPSRKISFLVILGDVLDAAPLCDIRIIPPLEVDESKLSQDEVFLVQLSCHGHDRTHQIKYSC